MKTPSNDLYQLVKSLTKSEKRYFKVNSVRGQKATKYLKIFEAMDQMDEYDEEELKKKFRNEPWIERFNAAKDYLNKALLDSLVQYNQSNEPQYRLADMILHIRVLQGKGFYSRCQRMINKAKKLAEELNDYHRLLELLEIEGLNHPAGINSSNRESILENQLDALEKLESEYRYGNIYKFSFEIFATSGYSGIHKGEENIRKSKQLTNDPLFTDFGNAKTFQSKWRFINMHYINSVGNRDLDEMYKWIMRAYVLFEQNPKLKLQHALSYAVTLLNLQEARGKRKEYKSALEIADILRSFYPRHLLKKHDRLTYFIDYGSTHQELELLCKMGEHERALDRIPGFRKLQKTYKLEISDDIFLQQAYLEAQIFFGSGEFEKANRVLDQIIRSGIEVRKDLQKKARILLLASYYETEKFELLDYGLRSTYRLFQRNKTLTDFDKAIFKLLRFSLDQFEDKEQSGKLAKELEELKGSGDSDVDYAEIIQWCRAKMEGLSLAEMAQKEAKIKP